MYAIGKQDARRETDGLHIPSHAAAQWCGRVAGGVAPHRKRAIISTVTETREGERNERHPRRGRRRHAAQVAEFTCATSQEVRRLLARGELKGCRVGKKWLVPKLALLNYLYKGEGRQDLQSA